MMRTITRGMAGTAIALGIALTGASAVSAQDGVVGEWRGTIDSPTQGPIEMIVRISAGEDGALTGTLDVPVQGGFGMALDDVTFEDGALSFGFSLAGPGTGYEGTMGEDGSTITGMWSQGGGSIELNLTRSDSRA